MEKIDFSDLLAVLEENHAEFEKHKNNLAIIKRVQAATSSIPRLLKQSEELKASVASAKVKADAASLELEGILKAVATANKAAETEAKEIVASAKKRADAVVADGAARANEKLEAADAAAKAINSEAAAKLADANAALAAKGAELAKMEKAIAAHKEAIAKFVGA